MICCILQVLMMKVQWDSWMCVDWTQLMGIMMGRMFHLWE